MKVVMWNYCKLNRINHCSVIIHSFTPFIQTVLSTHWVVYWLFTHHLK
uniref:Uncharacterized protein n=1 Tax=Anguilla anguilla TaxID=7936 RepID=A0A0E9T4N5_ANGAN